MRRVCRFGATPRARSLDLGDQQTCLDKFDPSEVDALY